MTVMGKSSYKNKAGDTVSTLYVLCEFEKYAGDEEKHRTCDGQSVEKIYVGKLDVSAIEIGDEVEVVYGKAVQTKTGLYQPIKDVRVI